jgi:hypothetical protein
MPDAVLAQACMDQMITALEDRGLDVKAEFPMLSVRNPSVVGEDSHGRAMSPGLSQQLLIRSYEGRGLIWCWVWPAFRSAERGAPTPPPEVEPMCDARDIESAADRVAKVVRLWDAELAGGIGDV